MSEYRTLTDIDEIDAYWKAGLLFSRTVYENEPAPEWDQDSAHIEGYKDSPSKWITDEGPYSMRGDTFWFDAEDYGQQFAVLVEE